MTRVSLKDFINMNERKLSRITARIAAGVLDYTDNESIFAFYILWNRLSPSTIRSITNVGLFLDYSLAAIPDILKVSDRIRIAMVSDTQLMWQPKDYTWTSFLFDVIDIAKTNPSYVRGFIGDILLNALNLRRNEITDSCFTAFDGTPIPANIRSKILDHLNFVQRVCDTGGFSLHDLKKIKVTLLAPRYTWKTWDKF